MYKLNEMAAFAEFERQLRVGAGRWRFRWTGPGRVKKQSNPVVGYLSSVCPGIREEFQDVVGKAFLMAVDVGRRRRCDIDGSSRTDQDRVIGFVMLRSVSHTLI